MYRISSAGASFPHIRQCNNHTALPAMTRILLPKSARRFSTLPSCLAAGPPQRFDATGRTPGFARRRPSQSPQKPLETTTSPGKNEQVSSALQQDAEGNSNSLQSPVHIPEDRHGILHSSHPATSILANSSLVVQRQLEMMNVFLGFEQANKYIVMDPQGGHVGYMAEQEHGIGNAVARQMFRTHRSFTTHVFDKHEREVLRFHRPFSWISSRIRVYDASSPNTTNYSTSPALQGTSPASITNQTSAHTSPLALSDMRIIGEAQQQWAPLRRRYNLFLHRDLSQQQSNPGGPQLTSGDLPLSNSTALQPTEEPDGRKPGFAQFASVDEPFLSWDFSLLSADLKLIGSVNRNFAGWGRELFTDTGVYALRMDAAGLETEPKHIISQTAHDAQLNGEPSLGMTLDQRAVMLATAVSIDFDYFSRHSTAGGGGFMPMWFPIPMGGGGAGAAEAGGAAAGAEGAAGSAAGGAGAVRGATGAEVAGAEVAARSAGGGAAAGAGTLAGYDAMQRGRERMEDGQGFQEQPISQGEPDDSTWDDWGGPPTGGSGGGGESGGGGGGAGGGGDGGGIDLDDFF